MRAGRHSHPAQLRSWPPRASTSIPRAGTQAFGASRRPVSNSDTILMRPSAGRPAGWSAGPGRVKSQAVASRPAESRIFPAAPPQRPARSRCIPAAATAQNLPWGKNLPRRGACGLERPSQNFLTGGGRVRKDPRATCDAPHACAQSWPRFAFQRRLFFTLFCHNSRAVLRLWQE